MASAPAPASPSSWCPRGGSLSPFLPVSQLQGVFAHAHLAVLGWGTLMVMGAGYRMIPMILPAAMPRGGAVWASSVLVEVGALGIAAAFLVGGRYVAVFGLAAAAGIAVFLCQVVRMLGRRRPAPKELPRPDWSALHVLQSLAYLALASLLGLVLAIAPAPLGVPGLAAGFVLDRPGLVGGSGALLLAAVVASAVNLAAVRARLRRSPADAAPASSG